MRRWVPRIFVFLLLGAIVSIAVAWIGAAVTSVDSFDADVEMEYRDFDDWPRIKERLPVDIREQAKGLWYQIQAFKSWGVDHVLIDAKVFDENYEPNSAERGIYIGGADLQKTMSGWPARALVGECWKIDDSSWLESAFLSPYEPYDDLWTIGLPRLIPVRPIWPGFAINTVFYAVILWMLFAAPFALRRRRRIKRCLCPKCAYDLRGTASSACPECGATR